MDQMRDDVRRAGGGPAGGARPSRRAERHASAPRGTRFLAIAGVFLLLGGDVSAQQAGAPALPGESAGGGAAECLTCHALPNLGYRESGAGPMRRFTVAPGAFRASVHGKLACRQCHGDLQAYPHDLSAPRRRVSCDQDCHATDEQGRPYTHTGIARRFAESVHGRAGRGGAPPADAPTCLSCHGQGDPHAIVPPAQLSRPARMALCVGCHDDRALMAKHRVPVDAVASYRRSFHYKAVRFGGSGTAICIDCHTAHHVLPPSDPRSSVAPAALTRTCGKTGCHRGAGRNFAVSGANHLDLRVEQEPLLWFEEKFFLLLTGGTMLMLIVGIVLDVQRKFGWVALVGRAAGALERQWERARPSLARLGRRGLLVARHLLID